jgi:hypothetical protein
MNEYKATKDEIITAIGVIGECLKPNGATRQTCDMLRELWDELEKEEEAAKASKKFVDDHIKIIMVN